VAISHADRVMFPQLGLTKLDVATYYASIADWMLPHVVGRPLTLVRCPVGAPDDPARTKIDCQYMRHGKAWGPSALRRVNIQEKTKVGEYLVVEDVAGLVALAQMSILEIHTWNSAIDDLERPNRLVFDLDPDESLDGRRVIEGAKQVRDRLAELELESFVKTTGGKGLHVVVPLVPNADWEDCFAFARAFAASLVREDPHGWIDIVPKARRRGKILIDYLRNNRTNTSIAAYSTRARGDATVSVPLAWRDLVASSRPERWTIETIVERLVKLPRDPWKDYWRSRQKLDRRRLRAMHAA